MITQPVNLSVPLPARKSRWIPWAFVGFFAVVAAVQAVMIWLAIESFSGLGTDSPYERGLGYNRTLAAEAAQVALGWQVGLVWEAGTTASDPGAGRLTLELADKSGAPLGDATAHAILHRPVGPELRVEARLIEETPGRYAAMLILPAAGNWDVDLDLLAGTDRYHLTQRIFAP